MIQVSGRHKIVGVPLRSELRNLFPDAKVVTFEGDPLILLPHRPDVTRLLNGHGLDVPAPILTQYDWAGGKPFDVQRKTCALLTTYHRAYVLNTMGTGKTKAALWSWHYLHWAGFAGKLLVVAPLSTLHFVWAREAFQTLPGVTVEVLHGTRAKRLERLEKSSADIFVINHDGLAIIADALRTRTDIDTLVLDELATYRNGSASRTKIATVVAQKMRWAWGMTGSPTPREPTDAWAQCRILTPNTVPPYFRRFRDETMIKVTNFLFRPKRDALDRVHQAMQPAVRYTLDDIVELPDIVERTVDVAMGVKQERVYKQMEQAAHVAVQQKEITAMNAGAVLSKLLQISTGWVYAREQEVVALDGEPRLEALSDAIEACDEKVLVFVPFKHALAGISEHLTKEGVEHAVVSGDTPKKERDEVFIKFQQTDKLKAIVAHPQCMAHGLTLTAASTIIWFAPTPDLEIFEQANARIRRVGQKHKQLILMFQATKAERQMYAKLRSKQKVQNLLLELFETTTE